MTTPDPPQNILHRLEDQGQEHPLLSRLEDAYLRRLADPEIDDSVLGYDGSPGALRMAMRADILPSCFVAEEIDKYFRETPPDRAGIPETMKRPTLSSYEEALVQLLSAVEMEKERDNLEKEFPVYFRENGVKYDEGLTRARNLIKIIESERTRDPMRIRDQWDPLESSIPFALDPQTMEYVAGEGIRPEDVLTARELERQEASILAKAPREEDIDPWDEMTRDDCIWQAKRAIREGYRETLITGRIVRFQNYEIPVAYLSSYAQRAGKHLLPSIYSESGRKKYARWQGYKEICAAFLRENEIAIPVDKAGGEIMCPRNDFCRAIVEERRKDGSWIKIEGREEPLPENVSRLSQYDADELRLKCSQGLRNRIRVAVNEVLKNHTESIMLAIDTETGRAESEKGFGIHHVPLARLIEKLYALEGRSIRASRVVLAYGVNVPGIETALATGFYNPNFDTRNKLPPNLHALMVGYVQGAIDPDALRKTAQILRKGGHYLPVDEDMKGIAGPDAASTELQPPASQSDLSR